MRSTWRAAPLAVLIAAVVAFVAAPAAVSAHDDHDGRTLVTVDDLRVVVTAVIPFADLGYTDTSGDTLIDHDELREQEASVAPTLVGTARNVVSLTIDGRPTEIIGAGVPSPSETVVDEVGASPFAMLVLASAPHDGNVDDVELVWDFDTPSTVFVLSHGDDAVMDELSDDNSIAFSLDVASNLTSFSELAATSTIDGPEHRLFSALLALAVAGVIVTTWRTVTHRRGHQKRITPAELPA